MFLKTRLGCPLVKYNADFKLRLIPLRCFPINEDIERKCIVGRVGNSVQSLKSNVIATNAAIWADDF